MARGPEKMCAHSSSGAWPSYNTHWVAAWRFFAGVGHIQGLNQGKVLPHASHTEPKAERPLLQGRGGGLGLEVRNGVGGNRRVANIKNSLEKVMLWPTRWRWVKILAWFNMLWKYSKPYAFCAGSGLLHLFQRSPITHSSACCLLGLCFFLTC